MFGECHAHMLMDGVNYREAVARHRDAVCEEKVREFFEAYQRAGVSFIRDGGDNAGVSKRASEIAGEYGIDYRTPIFAVHKEGHYGRIVGRSFSNMKEFHQRVQEAAAEGADFIKIMTTGLLDFNDHGVVTGTPLDRDEVREMVHIAHEEGFAVMSHTNGIYGVQAAVEAGVDSLEHGNYMDEETLSMLADINKNRVRSGVYSEKRRKQTIREEKWTCEVGAGACDCQSTQEVQADGRDSFPGSGAGCL